MKTCTLVEAHEAAPMLRCCVRWINYPSTRMVFPGSGTNWLSTGTFERNQLDMQPIWGTSLTCFKYCRNLVELSDLLHWKSKWAGIWSRGKSGSKTDDWLKDKRELEFNPVFVDYFKYKYWLLLLKVIAKGKFYLFFGSISSYRHYAHITNFPK